ncbi:MAG TPA: DUF6777 domain-containing protein, partial [Pseudonocardia sp.]
MPKIVLGAITAVAVGLVSGVVWGAVTPGDVVDVSLEAHSTAGENPFMAPVGEDQPTLRAPSGSTGTFSGATPGLYADSADRPSCDTQRLVSNLQSDSAKASAWAQALNIRTEDIPSYAQSLNPVVLRADTAVTEHGYTPPSYAEYPAVLQTGTAVFVNSFGEPTVKCFSGNPLTRSGDFTHARYSGSRWQDFGPDRYVYVVPTRVVIVDFSYYDWYRHNYHYKRSWCSDHGDKDWCKRSNPEHWCKDSSKHKGCKFYRDWEKKHRNAQDRKGDRDRAHHDWDEKNQHRDKAHRDRDDKHADRDRKHKDADDAERQASDAETKAGTLRKLAEAAPEPLRSQLLGQADQADKEAKDLRGKADRAKDDARKGDDDAKKAEDLA